MSSTVPKRKVSKKKPVVAKKPASKQLKKSGVRSTSSASKVRFKDTDEKKRVAKKRTVVEDDDMPAVFSADGISTFNMDMYNPDNIEIDPEMEREVRERMAKMNERSAYAKAALQDVQRLLNKPKPLTLSLIARRNNREADDDDHKKLFNLSTLYLDGLDIGGIAHLECFTNLTHLYAQSNQISKIDNLEFTGKLQFLTLKHNKIKVVENLDHLLYLWFLDLSDNQIEEFDVYSLPRSLRVLNYANNPCITTLAQKKELRSEIICILPFVETINDVNVTKREKREQGWDVSSDDEDDPVEEEAPEVVNDVPEPEEFEAANENADDDANIDLANVDIDVLMDEYVKKQDKYNVPVSKPLHNPHGPLEVDAPSIDPAELERLLDAELAVTEEKFKDLKDDMRLRLKNKAAEQHEEYEKQLVELRAHVQKLQQQKAAKRKKMLEQKVSIKQ